MPNESKYYRYERSEMLGYVPADARKLLEVGCGQGRFSGALKQQRKIEVWGIEKFPEAARAAELVLDRVVISDVESALPALPVGYFDCVVFNDVLEHLLDPWYVLRELHPKLQEHGCVVSS